MKKCVVVLVSVLLSCALNINAFAEARPNWNEIVGGTVFIGDSYCLGTNAENDAKRHPEESWAQMTVEVLELTDYAISCRGGVGLAREKDGATFLNLLDDSLKQISNPNTIGWIIVLGGYNDYPKSYDDIVKNGIAFVEHARELYPNAKIYFGMIGYDSKRPERQKKLEEVVAPAWREVANQTGETYDGIPEIVLKQAENSMSDDGIHPNIEGQYALEKLPELFLSQRYRDNSAARQEQQKAEKIEKSEQRRNTTSHIVLIIIVISIASIVAYSVIRIKVAERKKSKQKRKRKKSRS